MKTTISILLLFVCFGCKIRESKAGSTYKAKSITVNSTGRIADGQQDDDGFIVPDSQVSATTTPTLVTSIWGDYDTQKVIMLVCDTSHFDRLTGFVFTDTAGIWSEIQLSPKNTLSFWQYGYEVCEIITHADNVIELGLKHNCTYLDADKKPLSKSIIVWQTKELK